MGTMNTHKNNKHSTKRGKLLKRQPLPTLARGTGGILWDSGFGLGGGWGRSVPQTFRGGTRRLLPIFLTTLKPHTTSFNSERLPIDCSPAGINDSFQSGVYWMLLKNIAEVARRLRLKKYAEQLFWRQSMSEKWNGGRGWSVLAAPQQGARLDIGEEHADVPVGVFRGPGVVPVAASHPRPNQGEED